MTPAVPQKFVKMLSNGCQGLRTKAIRNKDPFLPNQTVVLLKLHTAKTTQQRTMNRFGKKKKEKNQGSNLIRMSYKRYRQKYTLRLSQPNHNHHPTRKAPLTTAPAKKKTKVTSLPLTQQTKNHKPKNSLRSSRLRAKNNKVY